MFQYMFRSLSSLFTVLYLLISMGACSVAESTASPLAEIPLPAKEKIAVNIIQTDPDISLRLQQAADQFAAGLDDEVSFHIQTVAAKEDYRAAMRSKLLSGEAVSLFQLLDRSDVVRLQDQLENLTAALRWSGNTHEGLLDTVLLDGAQYGIPYALEGMGLVANRRIFEAAGLDLHSITDYESLETAFRALQQQIDAGGLIDSFPELTAVTDLAVQNGAYLAEIAGELLLTGAYSSPVDASRSDILGLPGAAACESFLKMLARYSPQRYSWNGFASVSETFLVEGGLAAQRIAVIPHSTEVYKRVYHANPDLEGGLTLLPFYLEDSEQGTVFFGTPAWWAVNREGTDKEKDCALNFLTWLYQTEEGAGILSEGFGVLNPYHTGDEETGIALYNQLLHCLNEGGALPMLLSEAPSGWDQVCAAQLQEYFTAQEKTWDDLVKRCRDDWEQRRNG